MALVQKGTRVTSTGTTTPSISFPGACTSADTILSIASWEQPLATLNTVADPTNGGYTLLPAASSGNNGSGGDGGVRIGYFPTNAGTTALTLTFTFSSGVDSVIDCYEIPASTLDKHAEDGNGLNVAASININGAAANAFLLAGTHRRFGGAGVDAGISGVSDYLDVNISSGQHSAQYSNNAGGAGNKQIDFNDTSAQPAWATAGATFVAAGGGGSSPNLMAQSAI